MAAMSLPATRTTSPQSDIQLVNRQANATVAAAAAAAATDAGAAAAAITTTTPRNLTMILPLTIPTSVDIKKVYSDNDINYDSATGSERFALSSDWQAQHYRDQQQQQLLQQHGDHKELMPDSEDDHQDQLYSYHTL